MLDPCDVYKAYMGLFYLEKYKENEVLDNVGLDKDEAYNILNNFWNYSFGYYLIIDDDNKSKLFNFANDVFRYKLLNDHINIALDDFIKSEKSPEIVDYLKEIIDINENQFSRLEDVNTTNNKYAYLSPDDLINHFVDFLIYIDSSNDYLSIFKEMIDNRRLIFLDLVSDESKKLLYKKLGIEDNNYDNFFWHSEDYGGYVFITRNNDINDFKALAHEFAHYISFVKSKNNKISNILSEFPALYYEMLSCNFLLSKGYSSKDIQSTILDRIKYIYDQSEFIANINIYLKLYMECTEDIKYEDDVSMRKNQLQNFIARLGNEQYEKLSEKEKNDLDPYKLAKEFCDFANFYLGLEPCIVSKTYPYLFGYYLAKKFIWVSSKDDKYIKEMKYITDNLANINVGELLNNEIIAKDGNNKVYRKKYKKKDS